MAVLLEGVYDLLIDRPPQYWETDPACRRAISAGTGLMWTEMTVDFGNNQKIAVEVLFRGDKSTPPMHPENCAVKLGTEEGRLALHWIKLDLKYAAEDDGWTTCLPPRS